MRTDWAPLGAAAGDAIAARKLGMVATIYHWAVHPWAIYQPDNRREAQVSNKISPGRVARGFAHPQGKRPDSDRLE